MLCNTVCVFYRTKLLKLQWRHCSNDKLGSLHTTQPWRAHPQWAELFSLLAHQFLASSVSVAHKEPPFTGSGLGIPEAPDAAQS